MITARVFRATSRSPLDTSPLAFFILTAITKTTHSKVSKCDNHTSRRLNVGRNQNRKNYKMKPPPIFGKLHANIIEKRSRTFNREFSTSDIDLNNRQDCPICEKYSRGPCGDIFQHWLKCTDENSGKNSLGKDLHLEKCQQYAAPLAKCLQDHENFYEDNTSIYRQDENENENNKENSEKEKAWKSIIEQTELKHHVTGPSTMSKVKKFPNSDKMVIPEMQVHFKSRQGVAIFLSYKQNDPEGNELMESHIYDKDGRELLFVYMKDQNGNTLGAASFEDIYEHDGMMRFKILNDTEKVTLYAVYDYLNKEEDVEQTKQVMYSLSNKLPSK